MSQSKSRDRGNEQTKKAHDDDQIVSVRYVHAGDYVTMPCLGGFASKRVDEPHWAVMVNGSIVALVPHLEWCEKLTEEE
jgi:hypothetical protein